jgi:recombinational DNA repair protein (RecF pathway)
VRVGYFERPRQELVTIDRCDLEASVRPSVAGDISQVLALAYIAEVADRILPEHEASDASFRLLRLVVGRIRAGLPVWLPLTYYLYWMVRLGGFIPNCAACGGCGQAFAPAAAVYYAADGRGLRCRACRPRLGLELAAGDRQLIPWLAQQSLADLPADGWQSSTRGRGLRQFLHVTIETQVEAVLKSWKLLSELDHEPAI